MPASRRPRAVALALAGLFVAGQAALFTHQLFVPHQVCAEHDGELIHVEAPRPASTTPELPAIARAQWLGALHGHEHCTAFTSRREDSAAPPRPTPVELAPRTEAVAVAPEAGSPISRTVLLRLAPKNSPPV